MPHTPAASPIPPVTPETQAPPQTLGRESRRKSRMVRCSPPPHASGFSRNNHHNFELTLSPLSLEISGKKRWNLRLTLRHSSFNKTWNTKDATTTDPKTTFYSMLLPTTTIKVLQTSKKNRPSVFLLDDNKRSLQSTHTYSHHPFCPNRSRRHRNRVFFSSVISNQITTNKISKSLQVRSPKLQPSLNYVPVYQVSYQKVPITQIQT